MIAMVAHAWYRDTRDDELLQSVLVVQGDTTRNRTAAPAKSATSCRALERWLEEILASFGERVLA